MLATLCASHSPLIRLGPASAETLSEVEAGFKRLASFAENFCPDLVVQFSPDHFNGFFYDLMPSFCLGIEAHSVGDYRTSEGPLNVPAAHARELAETVIKSEVDIALSLKMMVDHGFVQIWDEMFGSFLKYPIIPIFINCAAPPIPLYRRVRLLGEIIGHWAKESGRRVLLVASGGLSHDPPIPPVWDAAPEVRNRLVSGRNPTEEMRLQHTERVLKAAEAAARGKGPCLPLNSEWDQDVMARFASGDLSSFDDFDPEKVRKTGGRGGNEILCWLAAFSAQSAFGTYKAQVEYYKPIDGWIAGMAMMTALPSIK